MADNLSISLERLNQEFVNNSEHKFGGNDEKVYHKLHIGFHTRKAHDDGILSSITEDVEYLSKFGFIPATQIFTQVPKSMAPINMEPGEDILKYADKHNMFLVIHSPYVINGFWKTGNHSKLNVSLKNAETFVSENFKGLVVHLPKQTPDKVANVIKNRQHTLVPILLENHAYTAGDDSYELPHKFNALTELLIANEVPNWGYCIDTAHLFVCMSQTDRKKGYCVENRKHMERWLSELSDTSRSKIKCWHLNGSVNAASSHKDEHAIPIFGSNHLANHVPDQIWGGMLLSEEIKSDGLDKTMDIQIDLIKDTSLVPILKHAMRYQIPVILEINRGDDGDIEGCMKVLAELEKNILSDPDF